MLYTKHGAKPEPLPIRLRLSDGSTRTDQSTFTAEEIADAGYVLAPEKPVIDETLQELRWSEGAWVAVDLPPAPVVVKKLSRFEFMGLLTAQERIALRTRANTDPIMADALDMLNLAQHVDAVPLHPMIAQMLGYVQQLGIMTAERRAAFIAAMSAAAK